VSLISHEPEHDIEVVLGRPAVGLDGIEGRSDIGTSPKEPTRRAGLDGDDRKRVRDSVVKFPRDPHPFVSNRQLGTLALFNVLVLGELLAKHPADRHTVAKHPPHPQAENTCDANGEVVVSG
jgi:hypothetical protein